MTIKHINIPTIARVAALLSRAVAEKRNRKDAEEIVKQALQEAHYMTKGSPTKLTLERSIQDPTRDSKSKDDRILFHVTVLLDTVREMKKPHGHTHKSIVDAIENILDDPIFKGHYEAKHADFFEGRIKKVKTVSCYIC